MKRILIAEDQGIIALGLKMELKTLGYDVLKSVTSGKDLISQALTIKPEIIVADINLKDDITGLEAISRIRDELNSIMIIITGFSDPHTLQEIRNTKADAYIFKPTNGYELHKLIMDCKRDQVDRKLEKILAVNSPGISK